MASQPTVLGYHNAVAAATRHRAAELPRFQVAGASGPRLVPHFLEPQLPDMASRHVSQQQLRMLRAVRAQNDESGSANAARAYGGKRAEFHGFCDHVFAHEPLSARYILSREKAYCFLFYQSQREKKKGGKKRKGRNADADDERFDVDDYRRIVQQLGASGDPPSPENGIGVEVMKQYRAVLMNMHLDQQNINTAVYGLCYDCEWPGGHSSEHGLLSFLPLNTV